MSEPIMTVVPDAPAAPSKVFVADCCAPRGDYQYMSINGTWFQIGWVRCNQSGAETTFHSFANPAHTCQSCGRSLDDSIRTRSYHAGVFRPVDSIVDVLARQRVGAQ